MTPRRAEAHRPHGHHHHDDEQEQDVSTDPAHAPDGQHCNRCNGVHNPEAGVTFVTSRTWGPADDDEDQDDDRDDEQD